MQKLSGVLFVLALLPSFFCAPALAQSKTSTKYKKVPSPEKIVDAYLNAIGGKKRVAAIKDATYRWEVFESKSLTVPLGKATTQSKAPASTRVSLDFSTSPGDDSIEPVSTSAKTLGRVETGATARSAWKRDAASGLRTLTDAEAQSAKLRSMLDASRLVDFKKAKVLARTAGVDESIGEASYVVEFSMRNGARLRYWFGTSSRLLLAIEDKTQGTMSNFADYRVANGILEPHQIRWVFNKDQSWTLRLQDVQYNTGLAETLFDPPSLEAIDVVAVLKELDGNQEKVDERVTEYTYTEKRTERKINDKGEVTEEVVKVFEVYPLAGRYDVHKLVSENGVALSPDKAAKEEKRVTDEMDKAERERIKIALKRESEKQKGKKEKTDDEDLGVADFLRVAELVSPRRERLRDRDAIVFDFRPRAGYKPKGSVESIVSKLAGVVWVDPVDKQVMRLEARLIESYKMGGGLLASVRPGTALVFEQKRMEDGVWLPVYAQVNISAKILLFKGINMNVVQEFSNYHRFKSNVDDYKITSP
jgi:hypothetical protein